MAVGLRRQVSGRVITDSNIDPQADRHSDRLLKLIDELVIGCGLHTNDLSAVAFDAGPGGFTRVRIACAVSQGIAMGLNIPVVAIDSLQAIALASASESGRTDYAICSDARMKQCYVGRYRITPDKQVQELEPAHTLDTDQVGPWLVQARTAGSDVQVAGSAFERFEPLRTAWGTPVFQPSAGAVVDAVLTIAQNPALWQSADQVAPRYVREKVALNVTEQAALRATRSANRS